MRQLVQNAAFWMGARNPVENVHHTLCSAEHTFRQRPLHFYNAYYILYDTSNEAVLQCILHLPRAYDTFCSQHYTFYRVRHFPQRRFHFPHAVLLNKCGWQNSTGVTAKEPKPDIGCVSGANILPVVFTDSLAPGHTNLPAQQHANSQPGAARALVLAGHAPVARVAGAQPAAKRTVVAHAVAVADVGGSAGAHMLTGSVVEPVVARAVAVAIEIVVTDAVCGADRGRRHTRIEGWASFVARHTPIPEIAGASSAAITGTMARAHTSLYRRKYVTGGRIKKLNCRRSVGWVHVQQMYASQHGA